MTPPDALPDPLPPPDPDRRSLLRAAGASLALATAAGCDVGPQEFGSPLYAPARGADAASAGLRRYATVLDLDGLGRGVLVRARDGHAIKIEGNPRHPASLGATDVFLESAVLALHDPARSRRLRRYGRVERDAALFARYMAEQRAALAATGGQGFRLLTGPIASPTQRRLIAALLAQWPGARWHVHAPLADAAAAAGARLAFGEAVTPLPDLSRATTVLCLGADPLGPGPAQLAQARGWAEARARGRQAGRLPALIVAESTPSLTGAKADRLLVLPPWEIEALARAVAAELGVAAAEGATHPEAAALAASLRAAGAEACVLAGRGQAVAVHALAHAINATLGAEIPCIADPNAAEAGTLEELSDAVAAGQVTHLLVLDANPVFDAPAPLDMAALLRAVPHSLHAGGQVDETALACGWHLPLRHPLECFGDSRAFDGTAALRQPATMPLVEAARAPEELLGALAGLPGDGLALVQETWRGVWGEAFAENWLVALEAGVIADSATPPQVLPLRADFALPSATPQPSTPVALFAPDPNLWDGRFATEAWLQELPRPLGNLAWGNAVLMAPADARAAGVAEGAVVELRLGGQTLRAPVLVVPGQAPGVVTLPLGGGRRAAGGVPGAVGIDAYRLRPAASPWLAEGLQIRATGAEAWAERGAEHALAGDTPRVRRLAPDQAVPPLPPPRSLYPDWTYPGHAWGMAIDLDTCIGCNACVVACQAENNTPVVGPEESARGRAMHWLRVDRVVTGTAEAPQVDYQPVPCMHCEKAPCEVVCPVNATVHDHEGLNLMVYPRCIGTRTCSNNCPYKVRKFNWAGYARQADAVPVRNPEVPLRPRGVIEKCTYCQHRIKGAQDVARQEGRALRDGEITTACQAACPTRAIHFGDINDPDSDVSRAKSQGRNYALLGNLDTRPRTTYLAKLVG
ncbi:4Fe-4S dicluster domain-containing protein [Falsiroseomonas tokyonensis]|uniref:4Fe-4S dicluster domain-containing protein n=1 Tax=Falsiroseomonas tokyonensis TaxID=430521 RepID=A0ABV7BST6_9PROT|nr:4Fe-4S dicluster domain-containing protein [Falsiroseomonas tokyonensis]MBU8537175.1 4Fe-4S dicluster domain-containing protein [Falsiroseomonas tokyonensis]